MRRIETGPPGAETKLLNHSFGWAMNPSFSFYIFYSKKDY